LFEQIKSVIFLYSISWAGPSFPNNIFSNPRSENKRYINQCKFHAASSIQQELTNQNGFLRAFITPVLPAFWATFWGSKKSHHVLDYYTQVLLLGPMLLLCHHFSREFSVSPLN
jgi:hypothetical protein